MTFEDFITELFCRFDDAMKNTAKYPQAKLYPSEVVTLTVLFAIIGGGDRAYYRWLKRDYHTLFPKLPERTHLFRLFKAHLSWTERFLHDTTFHPLICTFEEEMLILSDHGIFSKAGNPSNLKVCQRGTWNVRIIIETVLSMLTTMCYFKQVAHCVWGYFKAHLAFTMTAFNILAQWYGLKPDRDGFVHLPIAEFSL